MAGPTLDSCIASVFEPGNINASAGTATTVTLPFVTNLQMEDATSSVADDELMEDGANALTEG